MSWPHLLQAIRVPTLLTGLGPILLGNALGLQAVGDDWGATHIFMLLVTVVTVVLLQSGANLVNDVADAEKGIDGEDRLGPVRVTQSGLLPAQTVRRAYRFCFLLALIFSLVIAFRGGPIVIALALLCSGAAYAYTAGPFPLAYYGLGEVAALVFFGPVAVAGCYYLQTLRWDPDIFVWGLGPGFIAASLMAINNYRDRLSDRQAGKKTLATIFGDNIGVKLPTWFFYGSFGVLLLYAFSIKSWLMGALLVLMMFVGTRTFIFPILQLDGRALNVALKRTSLFNFIYAICFALVVCL